MDAKEVNYQIMLNGLSEAQANTLGNAISMMVEGLSQSDMAIDFSRMRRILITTDFAGELAALSSSNDAETPITHTNEEYALAVGKTLVLPYEDGYEIVPVINSHIATSLCPEDSEGCVTDDFQVAFHLLLHEFCHVNDETIKINIFKSHILKHEFKGKDMIIRPLADICWSEYIANYMSAYTASEKWLADMANCLAEAVTRTKQMIDDEILAYRDHADLFHLLQIFSRHGKFLVKAAAYNLGYLDGLGKSLSEISSTTEEALVGSYFEDTWNALHKALQGMRLLYPDGWNRQSIYDELSMVLENYYARMGFILSTVADGSVYIDIPFRPETTHNY